MEWKWHIMCMSQAKPQRLYWNYILTGWFLSFRKATLSLSPWLLCLFSSPWICSCYKREGCTPFQSLPGNWKELHNAEHLQIIFMPKTQRCSNYLACVYQGRGREGSLSPPPLSPAFNAGCCSIWLCLTSRSPGLSAVLWLFPLWTGVTFFLDYGQKK